MRDFSISDETVPAAHRGTYLAFTDRGSDGMRHLRRLARSGLNTVHLLPVNDIASIEEDRAAQQTPDLRPGVVPAGQRGAAGLRHRGRGPGRVQLGLRPAALHRSGGLVLDRSGGDGAQPGVPGDGQGTERGRPAGGDRRGLQPHAGGRAGPEVDLGPGGAGLLPPAEPHHRPGRDLDVLLQHGDRARHDGEADDRLGAHLGHRVQGRRLPVRPDGTPAEVVDDQAAAGAGPADAAPRRGRRAQDLHVRGGLELRRGRQQRPLRAGDPGGDGRHRDRDVQRPAA